MDPTALFLGAAFAALIAALVWGRRHRGWVPKTRERETFGELVIGLKCDAGPVIAELKPVNAELERMASLLDRIGVSLPKAVAAARQPEPHGRGQQQSNAKPRKRHAPK